jgi:hypothetical protein
MRGHLIEAIFSDDLNRVEKKTDDAGSRKISQTIFRLPIDGAIDPRESWASNARPF